MQVTGRYRPRQLIDFGHDRAIRNTMRFRRSFAGMAFAFWKIPQIRHSPPASSPIC
jgi:hypothetical protein